MSFTKEALQVNTLTKEAILRGFDQSQVIQDATQKYGESNATGKVAYIAQSFVVGSGVTVLNGVKLCKTENTGTPSSSQIFIRIEADNAGSPSDTALVSYTLVTAEYITIPTGEFSVIFSTPLTVVPGNTYWIVIRKLLGLSDTDHPNLGVNSVGGYASGVVKGWNITDGWTSISTIDFYFKTLTNVFTKDRLSANSFTKEPLS